MYVGFFKEWLLKFVRRNISKVILQIINERIIGRLFRRIREGFPEWIYGAILEISKGKITDELLVTENRRMKFLKDFGTSGYIFELTSTGISEGIFKKNQNVPLENVKSLKEFANPWKKSLFFRRRRKFSDAIPPQGNRGCIVRA